jgi:hypothetical protein
MSNVEHGISIGINRVNKFFFMKIRIEGTLTHEDYERMIPMLTSSIEGITEPEVRVLIDATDFKGWELRAAWDDIKFGMEYRQIFSKIAIVGTNTIETYAAKIGGWFIDGDMKFFESLDNAYDWLTKQEIIADVEDGKYK